MEYEQRGRSRPRFRQNQNGGADRRPAFLRDGSRAALRQYAGWSRRNAKSQIVQVNGEPLPRLYSAGEQGRSTATCTIPAATSGMPGFQPHFRAERRGGESLELVPVD